MNKLSKEDALLFHKLMDSLLLFVNQKTGIIKNADTMENLHKNEIEKTMLLRKKIFSDKYSFIDNFIRENPFNFPEEELGIAASWKKYKTGKFFIIKHTEEYSLFFSSESQKVYGVKGITDSFEEKFEGYAPVLVDITLIPFKENLIYDGLFAPYNISFGSGMRKSLKLESEEAIQRFGIITSLDKSPAAKQTNDEEMLRFYMKSLDNKQRHFDEINELKNKSKELEATYYQEEARDLSRHFKKSLKKSGVKGYFSVLVDTVVAGAAAENELKGAINKIVPEDKKPWLYTFKI
ncbi:MAG: hypothetical protein KKD94_06475 [Nanoarchaeota archaeon]|nr:hypothetical protein [Nanoarchaeota archaeon]